MHAESRAILRGKLELRLLPGSSFARSRAVTGRVPGAAEREELRALPDRAVAVWPTPAYPF